MGRKVAKKALIALGSICFLSFMIPGAALSWNQATHAYIADRLGARMGHDNESEMWGSVSPDLANYIFDSIVCPGWVLAAASKCIKAAGIKMYGFFEG